MRAVNEEIARMTSIVSKAYDENKPLTKEMLIDTICLWMKQAALVAIIDNESTI